MSSEEFSVRDPKTQTENDRRFVAELETYYARSLGTHVDRLRNFAKYVPRQALSLFLARAQLFERVVSVHGHIVECGVHLGGGLMTWAQLSAIFEPVNHVRRIVGFDTFTGFPALDPRDSRAAPALEFAREGGLATGAQEDIETAIRLYDLNRAVGHIPRVELVTGDALETIPAYVEANPHLVVAMLYLDFDVYAPTRAAIEALLPRIPKGGVIAFDELGQSYWPGETLAVLESVGLHNLRIQRFPFTPALSYAVLE